MKILNHKILLGVLVVGCLLVAAFILWEVSTKSTPKPSNFEQCKAAGNPIQESYPERCLTAEGVSFTNPDQGNAERTCPDAWYKDEMPGDPSSDNLPREYMVVDGDRRELSEMDVDWIVQSCAIKKPESVF